MKPIFIILFHATSGGAATLSIRIGERIVNHGYKVLYICQTFNDINNVNIMKEKGIKIYKWKLSEISKNLSYYNKCRINIITYTLDEHLFIETLKNRINIFSSTLYVIRYLGLIKGADQNFAIRKLAARFYRKVIKKMLDNRSVIFMNNQSIIRIENYYGINIDKKEDIIFHLPIEVKKYDSKKIESKFDLKSFKLLTIARAEFPFKGYIIGLIEDFKILCNTYKDISLTIITFGEDENKILQKIEQLPSNIKAKINLIGQTPYDKLYTYFDQSHLNIGMGTTILDAANHGVPSITAQANTYSNNSSGYFHMQPEFLAAYEDNLMPAINLIKKTIQMSKQEYMELCKIEHNKLEEYYDIDTLANHLINTRDETGTKVFTSFELKTHEIMVYLNKMLKGLKRVVFKKVMDC